MMKLFNKGSDTYRNSYLAQTMWKKNNIPREIPHLFLDTCCPLLILSGISCFAILKTSSHLSDTY